MNSLKSFRASRSQTGNGSGFPPTLVSPENLRGVSINAPNAGRAFRVPSKRLLDPVVGQGEGGLLGASTSHDQARMKSGSWLASNWRAWFREQAARRWNPRN